MDLKKLSVLFLATIVIGAPALSAETLPTAAMDREVTSREDSLTGSPAMTDPPKWQPAELPGHVIPSIKPIEGHRNQKVRTMKNMLPASELHKFHKVFNLPAVKVHPIAVKTIKVVSKPHPEAIRKE